MLAERLPDGTTRRDNLVAAARATGEVHSELLEALPPGGEMLWQAFIELSRSRTPGLTGAGNIPQSEIVAWQRNQRLSLLPWEIETIGAMDAAVQSASADRRASKRGH